MRRGTEDVAAGAFAEDVFVSPERTLADAQACLDDGRPFTAHEVLEAAWHAAPPADRDLWQGLAQVAVALTHAQRGNARGSVSLFRRAAERLAPYAGTTPYDVPVDALRTQSTGLAAAVEQRGTSATAGADVRLLGT